MIAAAAALAVLLQPSVGAIADLAEARAAELGRNHVSAVQAGDIARAALESWHRFRIPVVLTLAIIESESAYGAGEVSSAHCKGITQLNPAYRRQFAKLAGLGRGASITSIHDGILMTGGYLRYLWDRYGRLDHAVSAYNRGEGLFERQGKPVGKYAHSVLRRLPMLLNRLTPALESVIVAE